MAKPKSTILPLPGNSSGDQNFNSEQVWQEPDPPEANGNIGFDENYGLNEAKAVSQSPFANLKGGR